MLILITMAYTLRTKKRRNERLYQFWLKHRDWTCDAIGAVFHITGSRVSQIIKKAEKK